MIKLMVKQNLYHLSLAAYITILKITAKNRIHLRNCSVFTQEIEAKGQRKV